MNYQRNNFPGRTIEIHTSIRIEEEMKWRARRSEFRGFSRSMPTYELTTLARKIFRLETVSPCSFFFFLQPLVVVNLLTTAKWRDLVAHTCHDTNVRELNNSTALRVKARHSGFVHHIRPDSPSRSFITCIYFSDIF